jgi:hypothetical protein
MAAATREKFFASFLQKRRILSYRRRMNATFRISAGRVGMGAGGW